MKIGYFLIKQIIMKCFHILNILAQQKTSRTCKKIYRNRQKQLNK